MEGANSDWVSSASEESESHTWAPLELSGLPSLLELSLHPHKRRKRISLLGIIQLCGDWRGKETGPKDIVSAGTWDENTARTREAAWPCGQG